MRFILGEFSKSSRCSGLISARILLYFSDVKMGVPLSKFTFLAGIQHGNTTVALGELWEWEPWLKEFGNATDLGG